MSKKNQKFSISGKGYYIALVLCAVAVAVAGFFYYGNSGDKEPSLENPPASQQVDQQKTDDVEAVATQPEGDATPTAPKVDLSKKPAVTKSPVAGQTVAEYSMEALSYNQTTRDWRVHDGVDIAAEAGATVCAAADGQVYTVYEDETMGMTVVIRHEGGYTTKYASLDTAVSVKAGDTVTAGQAIGKVGNSALLESSIGDHVHFSVSCDGVLVDPAEFLK